VLRPPGKAYGQITAKALAVLQALLWRFHNASSGRCFPSYEAIAEAAGCARSTVYEAIRALEQAGVLPSCVQKCGPLAAADSRRFNSLVASIQAWAAKATPSS
jgi:DNA-binding FadR family transcriptional regulator